MGVLEDLDARQRDVEKRLAMLESRTARLERNDAMTVADAASYLQISPMTVKRRLSSGGRYFDADLAACSYMEGGVRRFIPKRLEAYREAKAEEESNGRIAAVSQGADLRREGPGAGTAA